MRLFMTLSVILILVTGCGIANDESKIIYDPDERLRKISSEVQNITKTDLQTIDDMTTEVEKKNAAGLAAPQIGVNKRIIVINDSKNEKIFAMINPQILSSEGQTIAVENCLSIKGIAGIVKRSDKIKVSFMDEDGKKQNSTYTGLTSRIIQHEIDHLNGTLFYDIAKDVFNEVKQ